MPGPNAENIMIYVSLCKEKSGNSTVNVKKVQPMDTEKKEKLTFFICHGDFLDLIKQDNLNSNWKKMRFRNLQEN